MNIKFLGAAGTVTGSCYLLTPNSGQPILIDCGLFQGLPEEDRLNATPLECDVSQVGGLILTHAHLDHCGRLPTLPRQGFHQPIYTTAATRDITEISLYDAASIASRNHKDNPLFEEKDVDEVLKLFKTVEYRKPFKVGSFEITFRDAGHILGSASLEIIDTSASAETKRVVFSGDLGNTPQELIQPTELIDTADVVVMESTYGDIEHPTEDPSELIAIEVQAVEKSRGTLLIPSFSIERSQELLHRFVHLKKDGKVKEETPVYFDSGMAEKVTNVFDQYPELYNDELKAEAKDGTPFHFPGLKVVTGKADREEMHAFQGGKVIIAGSGMMNGGHIVEHAQHYLPLGSTHLLFVGYQGDRTLGRAILDGQKEVMIEGQPVQVNAVVSRLHGMSSHADQPKLLNWLKHIQNVKKVFITHGEERPRTILEEKIQHELGLKTTCPMLNEEHELAI